MVPVSADTYQARLARGEEIVLTQPRGRMLLFFLGCLVFTLIGLGMMAGGEGIMVKVAGGAAVLFFGVLGLPSMLLKAVRPTPQLKVSAEKGVWLRQGDASWLPWQQIRGVALGTVSGQQMVALEVDQEVYDRRFAESGAMTAALSSANQGIVGGPALVIPSGLSIAPEQLAAWLDTELRSRVPR